MGPLQLLTGVNINSAFGRLERTRAMTFIVPEAPEELAYSSLSHDQIVVGVGTLISASAALSFVEFSEDGTGLKVNNRGQRYEISIWHPIIRTRDQSLSLRGSFNILNSKKEKTGDPFEDRLRVVRLGAQYSFTDGWGGATSIDLEFSHGLDILHATSPDTTIPSRADGCSDFTKFTADITRRQGLTESLLLEVNISGQKTANTLLSSEEFSLGGKRLGRAYDPSEITGGDGIGASLELQYASPWKFGLVETLQFYGFYDIGAVWGPGIGRDSLASAVIGVRITLPAGFGGGLEIAKPLTTRVSAEGENGDDPRVFFNLSAKFLATLQDREGWISSPGRDNA